jgi:CheY-like chemotaxis protein
MLGMMNSTYPSGLEGGATSFHDVDLLLVEDNPNDMELTLRALRKRQLTERVFVVRDGAEALEFLYATGAFAERRTDSQPRVILLDLKLPKVDGLEVLRRIKSTDSTKTIPVVVLTSSQEERDVVRSYRLGVNSYIVKPVEFDEFMNAVSELGIYWLMLNTSPR